MKRSMLTMLVIMLVAVTISVASGEMFQSQASSGIFAQVAGCTPYRGIQNPQSWICTGWASRGTGSYYPYWNHNGAGWFQYGGPGSGPFDKIFGVLNSGDQICFKVRDTNNQWSNVDCTSLF